MNLGGWEYVEFDGSQHLVPRNDLREHRVVCWCGAWWDEESNCTIHNALDEREKYETGQINLH